MGKTNYPEGKTTYWVRGQRFLNDSYLRNGRERAEKYCLENFIPTSEIIVFDSMLECDRYEYLLDLQNKGLIKELRHHLKLPIIKEFVNANGDTIPALNYDADFVYIENGKTVVEDVKGASLFQDTRFEAIKQIFDYVYRERTYTRIVIRRDKEWVEWKLGDRKKPRKLIKKQSEIIKEQKAQLHAIKVKEQLESREKQRLYELRLKSATTKLRSDEKKRLAALEEKYKV